MKLFKHKKNDRKEKIKTKAEQATVILLSKDVGSQIGSQTIQMNSQSEGVEQFALGALQDVYRSTTQALSKNIKKNKAKLKYNTQVFLVNNKDKEQ